MIECTCHRKMVSASGRPSAPILIVGGDPGYEDLRSNFPFSDEAGQVLRRELTRAGIQLNHCRFTLLWKHDPKVGKEFKEACFAIMMQQLMQDLAGAKAVLLLGADVTKIMTEQSVTKISACRLEKPAIFPASVELTMATYSPGVCLSMAMGDFRLAIERFARYSKEIRREYAEG